MLEAHLERLAQSAQAINLELPYSMAEITAAIEQLIEQYSSDTGYLRLVVTRGRGSLGVDPRKCSQPVLFIIADGLLNGITRAVVLDVADSIGIPCEEKSLRLEDLKQADECFLTGTGAELIPVRQIDGLEFEIPESPLTPVIMTAFKERIAQHCSRR